jgi:hypothetical protein
MLEGTTESCARCQGEKIAEYFELITPQDYNRIFIDELHVSPVMSAVPEVPKVGLEPTPSCEDRILSPVRLPYSWYWKHVAVILKGFDCKAVTILP